MVLRNKKAYQNSKNICDNYDVDFVQKITVKTYLILLHQPISKKGWRVIVDESWDMLSCLSNHG